jgi:ATP-dependent RNA helicase DDX52/ROK1
METQKQNVLQLLTHGLSFKKNKQEKVEVSDQTVDNYTVKKENLAIPEEDNELFEKSLKYIKSHQVLNDPNVLDGKSEQEVKAIHRRRETLGKFLKQHNMKISGDQVPLPIQDFRSLVKQGRLTPGLYKRLIKLGYTSPTPIQSQAFPCLLQNRNCLCVAPTGSGKTIAYVLPLLMNLIKARKAGNNTKALVIAPTFELSLQIYSVCLQLCGKVQSTAIHNDSGKNDVTVEINPKNGDKQGSETDIGLRIRHINKFSFKEGEEKLLQELADTDFLVCTPLKFLQLSKIEKTAEDFSWVILDEADKYFELGFLDQFKQITEVLKLSKKTYGLFSATFPPQIEKLVVELLVDPVQIIIRGKMVVLDSIEQKLTYCGSEFGKIVEIRNLIQQGDLKIPCLVFTQTKDRAKQLFHEIKNLGIPVGFIEAGLDRERRRNIINNFTLEKIFVLITTDLLARGLDFPKVRLVINYDMPTSTVNYIHRVGRTGRGGHKGVAITFYTNNDGPMLRTLGDLLKVSGCQVPDWILALPKPSKQVLKNLVKRPLERAPIDPSRRTKEYYRFKKEMKKKDREFDDKMERGREGIIDKNEKDPRVLMARKLKEMEDEDGEYEDED